MKVPFAHTVIRIDVVFYHESLIVVCIIASEPQKSSTALVDVRHFAIMTSTISLRRSLRVIQTSYLEHNEPNRTDATIVIHRFLLFNVTTDGEGKT